MNKEIGTSSNTMDASLFRIVKLLQRFLQVIADSEGGGGHKIYFVGDDPVGSGTIDDPIRLSANFTPEPPVLIADDMANTLIANHPLGQDQILVNINNGSFVDYLTVADSNGIIQVGDVIRASGYYKFKTKSAPGRNESATVNSPAFTAGIDPADNINPFVEDPSFPIVYATSGGRTYRVSGRAGVVNDFLPPTPHTVKATIRTSDTPGSFGIFCSQNGAFWLALDSSGKFTLGGVGGSPAQSPSVINDNAWHEIMYVRESDSVAKVYIDGNIVITKNDCTAPNLTANKFQAGHMGGSFDFIGDIDEIALWDFARQTSNYTPGNTPTNDTGLVGLWPFDNNLYNYAGT